MIDVTLPDNCPFCHEPIFGSCQSANCTNPEGLYVCARCYGNLCPKCAEAERDKLRAEVERLQNTVSDLTATNSLLQERIGRQRQEIARREAWEEKRRLSYCRWADAKIKRAEAAEARIQELEAKII